MMQRLISALMLTALLLPQATLWAQSVCQALVNEALSRIGTACANLDPDSACYGFPTLNAVFTEPLTSGAFSEPGDRVNLAQIASIQPAAANLTTSEYGISVISMRANLSNALPASQTVRLILIGGQDLESGVRPEDALPPSDVLVNALTVVEAQLRPTLDGATDPESYMTVPAGASVILDAISEDGQQVRAVYGGRSGWMDVAAISPDTDLSALPSIGPNNMTPMQSFYLPVNDDLFSSNCVDAPAMVVVQTPADHVVDIWVNGVQVRLEDASLIFRVTGSPSSPRLELVVFHGLVSLFPGTPQELIVPPGFTTSVGLDSAPTSLGIEGDPDELPVVGLWATPRALTQDELAFFSSIEQLPANILNYALSVPQLVQASGIGGPIPRLIFSNPRALAIVTRACEQGRLPEATCDLLLGP